MTYRRDALAAVGGFDERFPRAFREDADLGAAGRRRAVAGSCTGVGRCSTRCVRRPVGERAPAGRERRRHADAGGCTDRTGGRAPEHPAGGGAPCRRGRLGAAVAPALLTGHRGRPALAAAGVGRRHRRARPPRIAPGPRDAGRGARMLATSALMPAAATWHSGREVSCCTGSRTPGVGLPDRRAIRPGRHARARRPLQRGSRPRRPGARRPPRHWTELRALGVRIGAGHQPVRCRAGPAHPRAGGRRERAGSRSCSDPSTPWQRCPHAPDDGCACRKPRAGNGARRPARSSACDPAVCVVVGDIGSDVGGRGGRRCAGMLVPASTTRPEEVEAAPWSRRT